MFTNEEKEIIREAIYKLTNYCNKNFGLEDFVYGSRDRNTLTEMSERFSVKTQGIVCSISYIIHNKTKRCHQDDAKNRISILLNDMLNA